MDPLGGVVNVNLRIRFSKCSVFYLPDNLHVAALFMSLCSFPPQCSVYPTSSFPHEVSKLLFTGPFLTRHPICRGFIASLMVEERRALSVMLESL